MKRRFWQYPLFIIGILFIFFASCKKTPPEVFPNTVTDYDGNVYHTLQIGHQTWMLENLIVTHYRDGTPIPNIQDSIQWGEQTTGAYCLYTDSSYNLINYGLLYNWYAASDTSIAPLGFHVAADSDWEVLISYLGGINIAGGEMKTTDTTFWFTPNLADTSSYSGFNAMPCGYRSLIQDNYAYQYLNYGCFWWSLTSVNTTQSSDWYIYGSTETIYNGVVDNRWGLGIRCVKN